MIRPRPTPASRARAQNGSRRGRANPVRREHPAARRRAGAEADLLRLLTSPSSAEQTTWRTSYNRRATAPTSFPQALRVRRRTALPCGPCSTSCAGFTHPYPDRLPILEPPSRQYCAATTASRTTALRSHFRHGDNLFTRSSVRLTRFPSRGRPHRRFCPQLEEHQQCLQGLVTSKLQDQVVTDSVPAMSLLTDQQEPGGRETESVPWHCQGAGLGGGVSHSALGDERRPV